MKKLIAAATLAALLALPAWADGWKPPAGFHTESMKFPLDFAPQLPYQGVEELRFAPGFSNPQAPDYFTYSFTWQLTNPPTVTNKELEDDLTAYFDGLMSTIARENKLTPPKLRTYASLNAVRGGRFPDSPSYTGDVHTWDALITHRPLHLQVNVYQPTANTLYFECSPSLYKADTLLRQVRLQWP